MDLIYPVIAGRKWKDGEHSFHLFFFPFMLKLISHTSKLSYWKWPTGQGAVPHLQQSRRLLDCSFSSPCWWHTTAHPAGLLTKQLGLLWPLSDNLVCHFCQSVAHTHTCTAAASGLGGLGSSFFFLSSLPLHTGWLHCGLSPAIGSDLVPCILKHPATSSGTQPFTLFAGVSPPAFKSPLQSPFGTSVLGFCFFLEGGGCLW